MFKKILHRQIKDQALFKAGEMDKHTRKAHNNSQM